MYMYMPNWVIPRLRIVYQYFLGGVNLLLCVDYMTKTLSDLRCLIKHYPVITVHVYIYMDLYLSSPLLDPPETGRGQYVG